MTANTPPVTAIGIVSDPNVQRAIAANILQIQSVEEQKASQGPEPEHRDHHRSRERHAAEIPQIDQRLTPPRLDHDQRDRREHGNREQGNDRRRAPAAAWPPDDPRGQAAQHRDHQQLTGRVKPPRMLGPRLGHEPVRQHDRDQADRDIDPEDRTPPDPADQHAPEHRAAREAEPGHRPPHTEVKLHSNDPSENAPSPI
jgi:hypothetical protein